MKKKLPIIAITLNDDSEQYRHSISRHFAECILHAGGVPVYAPICPDMAAAQAVLSAVDGILFSGGDDIAPSYYGEETIPQCGTVSQQRDLTEKLLFECAYAQNMPILGICRGIQVMNVFAGGSLTQDIETQIPGLKTEDHRQQPPYDAFHHTVNILSGTPLYTMLGKKDDISVNSSHHQAIKTLAPGFVIAATSPDGKITEAIADPNKKFVIGVQWHPEYLFEKSEEARLLFTAFTEACK